MIYSVNEGQQAEEYKARKAKEAEYKKKSDEDRFKNRYDYKEVGRRGNEIDDDGRIDKTEQMVRGEMKRRRSNGDPNYYSHRAEVMDDATNRHIRRHPKQYKEGTIFESVHLI